MTPHWSASSRTVTESAYRQEVKELAVWCSLNNLELNTLKIVEMIVDFRRNPPALPPTYHHEQHCDCSGVIQIPGHHNFSGPEVGQSHWVIMKKAQQRPYFLRQLRKYNLPQELLIQLYSAMIESCPLHVNNCLIQLSYQIWPQKTTEGSPDCWANHWYNPLHSPRTVLIQSEQKGWQNHSGPPTSSTLPLWTVTVWSTLQSYEYQNDQTQEQFLSPSNPSHEHLTLNTEHTTLLYITYSSHILIFQLKLSHIRPVHYTYNSLYYILCFCYFVHCLFVYLYIIILWSVSCPVSFILLHCGAFVTITNSLHV